MTVTSFAFGIVFIGVSIVLMVLLIVNAKEDSDIYDECNAHFLQEFERICKPIIPSSPTIPNNYTFNIKKDVLT